MTVGIIDSGLGGLSVVKELKRALPSVPFIYLGDNARVPYGTRSPALIRRFVAELVDFFQGKSLDFLLLACHTISTCALEVVQTKVRWPVVDIVSPTIDYIRQENFRKVLLLGTPATVRSGAYNKLLESARVEIRSIAAPLLVGLAEYGPFEKSLVAETLRYYLDTRFKPEAVVLGCTHFPVFEQEIQRFFPKAKIINPAVPMVKLLQKKLGVMSLPGSRPRELGGPQKMQDRFYFTDLPPNLLKAAELFLGKPLENYSRAELRKVRPS